MHLYLDSHESSLYFHHKPGSFRNVEKYLNVLTFGVEHSSEKILDMCNTCSLGC